MQLNEDLIRSVVQQVLSQMGPAAPLARANGYGPSRRPAGQHGVYATVDDAVGAADAAYTVFHRRPLEDRRKAVACIKRICVEQAQELGAAELAETQIGRLDHKIAKLKETIPVIPGVEYLFTRCNSGDKGLTLTDYAPFGVIGAITPVTHSLPTLTANAISMLSAGNTVVFNAHPSGARIAAEGVRRFNQALEREVGIADLITIIDPPTLETAAGLFDHRDVSLLVVTGGAAVARAALASKKRAIVAGPGNPPVVVDETACLEKAAASIVFGSSYDNNLLCIGEKQVFAVTSIFDKLMDAVGHHGGFRLSTAQIESLTRAVFKTGSDGHVHLNKGLIGKDPAVLAEQAGVRLPAGTQLLYGETGEEHPFVTHEQMMPFLPFVRVPHVERAIELAKHSEHDFGHTAILHSRDTSVMQKMGRFMECTIFVVNGPCVAGLGLGGEGVPTFSIAGPTGEGVTTPLTFCRERRTSVIGGMRFI